jgi:hypothetical protein
MLGLGFAAFGAPRLIHRDALPEVGQRSWLAGSEGRRATCIVTTTRGERLVYDLACAHMPHEALRRLKAQATVGYTIPPALTQVTAARMIGETPNDVEGMVIWRTLFGLPVGTSPVVGYRHNYSLDFEKHLNVALMFLLAEGMLAVVLLRQLWRLWSDWFWPLSRP